MSWHCAPGLGFETILGAFGEAVSDFLTGDRDGVGVIDSCDNFSLVTFTNAIIDLSSHEEFAGFWYRTAGHNRIFAVPKSNNTIATRAGTVVSHIVTLSRQAGCEFRGCYQKALELSKRFLLEIVGLH